MEFRRGQWIKDSRGVGIFWDGQMHLVDNQGLTVKVLPIRANTEAVTKVTDVPKSRRAHLPDNYNPATKRVEE
jgi:hypothetical protein